MRNSLAQELGLDASQIETGLRLLERPRTVRRRGQTSIEPPRVIRESGRIHPAELYRAELDIAHHLRRLQAAELDTLELPDGAFGDRTPDPSQRAAVETALAGATMVITGGPGTGKTTVCRAVISAYETTGALVLGVAPTGKAAQRMRQQTGRPASTIHNAIGLVPGKAPKHDDRPPSLDKDGNRRGGPMECGAVICDETSMVDVVLFAHLLRAIPTGARLLIVGDVNQLPSIGAGRVLFDLIASQAVPCAVLTTIHRQASESRIPYVARDINQGRLPDLAVTGTDFTHWQTLDETEAADRIVRAVTDPTDSITARKGIPATDVQVIAPQYKGSCGVETLNRVLQARLNPAPGDDHNGDIFLGRGYSARRADRVIQTRNNYDLGVMNGEMGYVIAADPNGLDATDWLLAHWSGKNDVGDGDDVDTEVDLDDEIEVPTSDTDDDLAAIAAAVGGLTVVMADDGTRKLAWEVARVLVVDFGEGRRLAFTKTEAKELDLGYAVTVHRSQGSQWKAVIFALHCVNAFMLTRALVYTAITRAEQFCLTVGTADQLGRASRNTRGFERRTLLQERLAQTPIPTPSLGGVHDRRQ